MAFNTKTFMTRTASAAVFVVLLLGCVWWNAVSFMIFFFVVGLIGVSEAYKLYGTHKPANRLWGYGIYILLSMLFFMQPSAFPLAGITAALVLAGPIYLLAELFNTQSTILRHSPLLFIASYVAIPILLLCLMAGAGVTSLSFHPQKVLGMIFFIWVNDTGAYLAGSFLGKHKMYARVSPGKTWEGTIGGALFCVGLSFIIAHIFPQLAWVHWFVISLIVAVFGTLGDLVESMLKRQAGVKDSGSLMPGHGGVLDRFDSLFFCTPFVFCYFLLIGLV